MQRLKELDMMKTIGILLVVFGHITIAYTTRDVINLGKFPPFMEIITEYIYVFHMPAFVASSGAIYYFGKRVKGKYTEQVPFIRGKILRLLVPYFFFLMFMILPVRIFIGMEESLLSFFIKFILLMIGPHHLWYVIMILNVYILFNLFEGKIYKNKFLNTLLFFLVLNILGAFIPNVFQLGNTMKYLLYFYIGYCFQRNINKMKISKYKGVLAFALFIMSVLIFLLMQVTIIQSSAIFYYILQLIGAFIGMAMLYYISLYLSDFSIVNNKVVKRIEKDSFAIYLFHQGIIYLIVFWLRGTRFNPYLLTVLLFLITILLSTFLTTIFRKLKWNIFIGEK